MTECNVENHTRKRPYLSRKTILSIVIIAIIFTTPANAGCEVDISDYVGWEIIYSGIVTGYIDGNSLEEGSFIGCEYGRVLILDNKKTVTCDEYNYAYAYRPDIVIMYNGYRLEACIDDEMFEIR